MHRVVLSLAAVVLTATSAAFAQTGGITLPKFATNVFAKLDTDGDSKVSLSEILAPLANAPDKVIAAVTACFNQLDTDGDGFLTLTEFTKPPRPKLPAPSDIFTKLDTDGNSKLSLAEFVAGCGKGSALAKTGAGALFKLLDKDGDGFLTLSEFTSAPLAPTTFKH